jgi:hypothetical protein
MGLYSSLYVRLQNQHEAIPDIIFGKDTERVNFIRNLANGASMTILYTWQNISPCL